MLFFANLLMLFLQSSPRREIRNKIRDIFANLKPPQKVKLTFRTAAVIIVEHCSLQKNQKKSKFAKAKARIHVLHQPYP